jgi:Ca2+-binding RTX toxin-like protein
VSNGVESHDVSANVTLLGGNDLQGTGADEVLLAGGGDDILVGGAGDDILIGGGGGDGLSGGSGSDTFVWQSTDGGAAGSPVADVVSDFGRSEGDVLNLADLLVDESAGNLSDYLHFEQSDPDTVVLHVSSNGGFSGGYQASVEDQTIILENFSLDGLGTTDTEIIDALIAGNNLITD